MISEISTISGLFERLLILDYSIVVLDIEPSNVFDADLHTLFLSRREQLVLERVDAGLEALRINISGE